MLNTRFLMKSVLKFVFSKALLVNIILAILLLYLGFVSIDHYLDAYTKHGDSITVPDLSGYTVEELDEVLRGKNLRYAISDSIFNPKKKKGTIIDQHPKAETQVKENRKIYLTINSKIKQRVAVPDVADVSLKQALSILETYGIKIKNKIYVPSELQGNVLRLENAGEEITPGTMIDRGSALDIVIGQGQSDEVIALPNLTTKSFSEAKSYLRERALNLLPINWVGCATESDSLSARIIKQEPEWTEESVINLGKTINVWLSCDSVNTN